MPRAMNDAAQRLTRVLNALSTGQKIIGALLLVGLVIAGAAMFRWVSAPTYAPLFSNLAGADASAIVDKLDADGVKYKLSDGGGTVLVPKDLVYAERVKLSGAGLPSSSEGGYALLDKQGVTASQFQQQITYQRALEGELAKTVQAIDGVSSSVVHLAIPEKSVFLDEEEKPSASVLVGLAPGRQLERQQVQSVVNLVASSVQGMTPELVTVVDGKGQLLSATASADGGGAGGVTGDSREQMTADYERRQASALQAVLDKVLGPGKAVAQVTATLLFDDIDTTTERLYSDPKAKPVAETETTEKYSGGAGSNSSGVLGTDNIAVPSGSAGNGSGQYEKTATTRNNAVSKVTEKKKAAPGAVVKQSVAVVVDAKATGVDVAKVEGMVTTAAGIDSARGDTLSVTSMPFDTTAAVTAAAELKKAEATEQRAALMGYAKQGGMGLVVLATLVLAWLSRRKKRSAGAVQELVQLDVVEQNATMSALSAGRTPALDATSRLPALETADVGGGSGHPARRRDEVAALVERQPDEVAELLRGWLADRRN